MTKQPIDSDVDLTFYLDIVLRRRWIILAALVVVSLTTALITFSTRPLFQASTLLVIEKERGGGAVVGNGTMVENSNEDYYQTQYKLLQSRSLLEKVYAKLRLEGEPDFQEPNGVEKLQKAVVVFPVARSRLVYVRANSHDPEVAARIANTISERFVQENLENQLFISKEVLQALQVKQGEPDARRDYEALPAVVNNSLVQTLKGEYAKLESQAAEASQKLTPRHPAMIALRSNMAALRAQIDRETDKIVLSLKTELSGQLKGNNVRIVDPARAPKTPIKPRKRLSLALGLIGGLMFGLAIALLVEILDQTVRTQEDVENKLQLPFLGIVPQTRVRPDNVFEALLSSELSLTSEAFRNLRTMVDFAGVSQKSKTLMVTSSVQEEGKSFVATNLAVVFAQLGEKVLLIDGDLRRPKVHRNFQISSEHGLSEYLAVGRSVDELVPLAKETQVANLKVLPCGPRPPNPSELLNTPRLGALVSWAESNFDRVIVDCPPLFPINDTLLWGRHINSAAFVVRFGNTRIRIIKNAYQRLLPLGTNILGVALNSAKQSGLSYASYGYYYQQYYHEPRSAPESEAVS